MSGKFLTDWSKIYLKSFGGAFLQKLLMATSNGYLSEEALLKLTKDELVNLSLDYQNKFTSTLARIESDISNLRKDF